RNDDRHSTQYTQAEIIDAKRAIHAALAAPAVPAASPWRSIEEDWPPPDDIVLVWTGDAYSCEYGADVNQQDHNKWMAIPSPVPTKEGV
ncbi:MAG TPA: hypothetical protein VJU83_09695, partial [Burkholderiales bacterium]|nr:hypothetical protein [Burkholderiales bacterium]